jgi:hypothetical protein
LNRTYPEVVQLIGHERGLLQFARAPGKSLPVAGGSRFKKSIDSIERPVNIVRTAEDHILMIARKPSILTVIIIINI